MTRTSARTRRPEDRRDELLDAAEQMFVDKGVAATTVSDITDAAGVAKGTFYLYFGSKEHLVAGLHERLSAGMADIVMQALETIQDAGDVSEVDLVALSDAIVAAIIDFWIDHRALYVSISQAGDSPETARLVAEFDERIIQMLELGVRAGNEAGQFSVESPAHAARFLFWGCHGTTHAALVADGPIDRDELVAASQQLVRQLLVPGC